MANNFGSVFRNIEKTVKTSQRQALARAATSTRAKFAQEMGKVGIPSARARARTKIIRNAQAAIISIGMRVLFALHDFSPGEKRVTSAAGKRYAATYKVKGQGRVLAGNGAFLAEGKNSRKKIIIQRVGDARYPTTTVLTDIFQVEADRISDSLTEHMSNRFEIEFKHSLQYNLNKK